jgi:hypothetical protein
MLAVRLRVLRIFLREEGRFCRVLTGRRQPVPTARTHALFERKPGHNLLQQLVPAAAKPQIGHCRYNQSAVTITQAARPVVR